MSSDIRKAIQMLDKQDVVNEILSQLPPDVAPYDVLMELTEEQMQELLDGEEN